MSFSPLQRFVVELRLALGSRIGGLAFVALALAAALSLAVGVAEIEQQRVQISDARQAQEEAEKDRRLRNPEVDAGTDAYERFHMLADPPGSWAFVALGTRESAAPLQRLRALGLEAQIHNGNLVNPDLASAGTFDFAFVAVFLLPLALIAVLHDLRSGERECGRLGMISSLLTRPRGFWSTRLVVRWSLAVAAISLPLLVCALLQAAPLGALVLVLVALVTYATGWTLLAAAIALRPGTSSTSAAVTLLGLWSLWVLVLPGIAGAHAARTHPTTLGAETVLAQRQKVNDAWDLPKTSTFDDFFALYPEWSDTAPVLSRFHWKWYFAFHQVGDASVADQVHRYREALQGRENVVELWSVFVPPLALQRVLTAQAETDAARRWAHEDAVRGFHASLRESYYPSLFRDLAFDSAAPLPRFAEAARERRSEPLAATGLLAFVVLAGSLALSLSSSWSRGE